MTLVLFSIENLGVKYYDSKGIFIQKNFRGQVEKMKNFVRLSSLLLVFAILFWLAPTSTEAKVWWNGAELKYGQIGRLTVLKNTELYKLDGDKEIYSRTLKAGEFYRIYAFKPGKLSVGGGYYIDRDSRVKYETPSKAKLEAVKKEYEAQQAKLSLPLTESLVIAQGDGDDIYFNSWGEDSFVTNDGKRVNGVGFYPYSGDSYDSTRMWTRYQIKDYNYTTLETTLAIDEKWTIGDRGKTELVIYADNKLLVSKTFDNKTKSANVKLPLPTGTQNITLIAIMDEGSQGNHGAIFANPRLTNSLKASPKESTLALSTIGAAFNSDNDDVYGSQWNSRPFELTSGQLVARGYGFDSYTGDSHDSTRMFNGFNIKDYSYTTLETTISIDKKWTTGDRGKTEFIIFGDGKKLFTDTFENSTPSKDIKVGIPQGTEWLYLVVVNDRGSQGTHAGFYVNPVLTNSLPKTPPAKTYQLHNPVSVSDGDDIHTGNWRGQTAFALTNGHLEERGVGFKQYDGDYNNSNTVWANYFVGDYYGATMKTTLSLESGWLSGDRGDSIVQIYADDILIYETTLSKTSSLEDVEVSIPEGTKYLKLLADVGRGTSGTHGVIFADPVIVVE